MKYDENYSPGMEKGCLVGDFIYDASKGVTGTVVDYGGRYGYPCYEYEVKPGVVLAARREDIINLTRPKEKTMQETKSNNSNRKEFAVGDVAYCAVHGKVSITDVFDGTIDPYCVSARISNGQFVRYTKTGRLHASGNRTLFFSPASIVAGNTEKPFKSELVGKEVLITFKGQFILNGKVLTEDENYICLENDNQKLVYQKSSIKSIKLVGQEVTF